MQKQTIQILSVALFLGFLTWGVLTFLAYLGVPVHQAVLFGAEAKGAVALACPSGSYLCAGLHGFFPFIAHAFANASPFLWYGVLSLLFYGVFIAWRAFTAGEWAFVMVLNPLKVLVLFLCSLWLIFTVLSFTSVNGATVRRVVEPTAEVYKSEDAQTLKALQKSFQSLSDRGCLSLIGQYDNGAKAYDLKTACVQLSFVTRVLTQVLVVLALLFELLVMGRLIFSLLRFRPGSRLTEALLSAGLGACAWIVLLWVLAVVHVLWSPVGWTLILLVPLIGYRHSLYWLRALVSSSSEVRLPWYSVRTLLVWLLVSYLALNFLSVVRPFPIGWDDLGSYLNRPRLMVSYGGFIFSMAPFQWEYLTSLGFLLFGYSSHFGATASMMVNWTAGLLAVATVFVFTRTFLGRGHGVLAALLYYTLPLVGHFSFADMKIDNAVFTMGSLGVFALFSFLFPPADKEDQEPFVPSLWLVVLTGVFLGFAFAMKPTAIMVTLALGAILFGITLHWTGFFTGVALVGFLLFKEEVLNLAQISQRIFGSASVLSAGRLTLASFIVSIVFVAIAFTLGRARAKRTVLIALLFGGTFLASIVPWVYHNNLLRGHLLPVSLEFGAPNDFNPLFDTSGSTAPVVSARPYRALTPELRVDPQNPACKPTGGTEELDRYWGYGQGWSHYLTLPWRTVMNIDSAGYYVTTMPALLLFPLLLLLPFFWLRRGRWLLWLTLATAIMILEWMFLGNGILWYGIGIFLGLVVGLEVLVSKAPDLFSRWLVGILIGLSLLTAFTQRFWQFDIQRNTLEYPFGKISGEALQ
ncbi:MAG: hypothetical protein PHI23_04965, partial [Candidatus Peribacteraceae bacterium]|nr:hypothetical protein [Candidatus Peribacteraceae bacterium]